MPQAFPLGGLVEFTPTWVTAREVDDASAAIAPAFHMFDPIRAVERAAKLNWNLLKRCLFRLGSMQVRFAEALAGQAPEEDELPWETALLTGTDGGAPNATKVPLYGNHIGASW